MNTPVIQSIIRGVVSSGSLPYIPLMDGLRLQVLAKLSDLPRCHKHQFAAFVLEPPLLVVWDDEADRILERAEGLEKNLIRYIWQDGGDEESGDDEKASPAEVTVDEITPSSLEEGKTEDRPVRLTSPVIVGMTLGLSVVCLGLGWRSLALQTMVDGDFKRLALVAVSPLTMFISLVRVSQSAPGMMGFLTLLSSSSSSSSATSSKSSGLFRPSPPTRRTILDSPRAA